MRYRINWTESVGYYAYVEADSKAEAWKLFYEGPDNFTPPGSIEPDGYCEMQDDAEIVEDPLT